MLTVGVVGAGASGIMAALTAAGAGAQVLLFDTNRVVGRKLAVTGNGRGNLTNLRASASRYHCADHSFVERVLAAHGPAQTRSLLGSLGVLTYCTPDGWCYPVSESAAAAAELMGAALDLAGVEVRLLTKVDALEAMGGRWRLRHSGGSAQVTVDRVVVATGGPAAPALGASEGLIAALAELGLVTVAFRPALTPLTSDMRRLHRLQGVRLDVGLRLLYNGQEIGSDAGNLMFTQSGLSGPAPMNLSHLVDDPAPPGLEASIDLVPTSANDLRRLVGEYRSRPISVATLLGSVVPPKVPPVLMDHHGLSPEARLPDLSEAALDRLMVGMHDLRVRITGTRGFQHAQLAAGGVPVTEVDPATMESRRRRGLYLAGEVLDVVGPCGGYNLQFAFSTGCIAGRAAARTE